MAIPTKKESLVHNYPWWCARFWHGMLLPDWLRLVARNRFRIHPLRIGLACTVTTMTAANSLLAIAQNLIYGRRVARTEIRQPPVFIIGHWRSGTTYLHDLLSEDDRFTTPTTFQCFMPNHFLLSEWFFSRFFWFTLPTRRPMDNIVAGFDRPQEDEFALCNLGVPSPYFRTAFPNEPLPFVEYLDMEGLSEEQLARWKDALMHFARLVTFRKGKRLVFKSPPHTGRVKVLSELFPGAKFIHLVRNPYELYLSTLRVWQALDSVQALQLSTGIGLKEQVLSWFERMYRGFERQRQSLDPGDICDVRYEELVRDPIGQLETVYTKLSLGDFERVRPKLEAYARSKKDYKANKHAIDESTRAVVAERWGDFIEKYGYADV